MTEKDRQALKAAEDHVYRLYTSFTRNITKHWGYDDDELARLKYNKDGYLIAGIKSSRIVEHTNDEACGEVWCIEVTPDVGVDLEPEVYNVYQYDNGEWEVESD